LAISLAIIGGRESKTDVRNEAQTPIIYGFLEVHALETLVKHGFWNDRARQVLYLTGFSAQPTIGLEPMTC
jgi:hypothetical protein